MILKIILFLKEEHKFTGIYMYCLCYIKYTVCESCTRISSCLIQMLCFLLSWVTKFSFVFFLVYFYFIEYIVTESKDFPISITVKCDHVIKPQPKSCN